MNEVVRTLTRLNGAGPMLHNPTLSQALVEDVRVENRGADRVVRGTLRRKPVLTATVSDVQARFRLSPTINS